MYVGVIIISSLGAVGNCLFPFYRVVWSCFILILSLVEMRAWLSSSEIPAIHILYYYKINITKRYLVKLFQKEVKS